MSYAPYPAYKESGIPWLGDVPEGWTSARISYFFDVQLGKMLQPEAKSETDVKRMYLRAANIKWSGVDLTDVKQMYFSVNDLEKYALKNRDVLISEGGDVGRSSYWADNREIYIQNAINRLRAINSDVVSTKFAFYWFYLLKNAGLIDIRCNSSTIAHFTAEKVKATEFVCPPITEQTAIADFLDKKTAEIDGLIAKQEALLRLLAEQRTALITHAVTKGLNPNAPMKPSGIDWLGDVPEGWRIVPFRWCCKVRSGQVDPKLKEYKDLPLIAPDHIESGSGRLLPYESAEDQGAISGKYWFAKGDVLYSKIRPELSKVAIAPVDGLCSADMYAIRPLDILKNEFVFYQLLSRHFHRFAVLESMRVAMPKINREALAGFPIVVPPIGEQIDLIGEISERIEAMDRSKLKISEMINCLKEYRTALITNAVTGKIKVT